MIKRLLSKLNFGDNKTPIIINQNSVKELPAFTNFAREQLSQWHAATLDVRSFEFMGAKNCNFTTAQLFEIFTAPNDFDVPEVSEKNDFKLSDFSEQEIRQAINDIPVQELGDGSLIFGDPFETMHTDCSSPEKCISGPIKTATYQESIEFINNHLACELFGLNPRSDFFDFSFAPAPIVKERQTWFWSEVERHFQLQPTRVYKHIADPSSYFDNFYYNFCYIYLDDKRQQGIVLSGAGAVD